MKYTTLLIISKHMIDLSTLDLPYLLIQDPITFINDHIMLYGNEEVSFEYLLIISIDLVTNSKILPFIIDRDRLLTNYYHQTNIEHIYFFENDYSFFNKLQTVCHHILNIE